MDEKANKGKEVKEEVAQETPKNPERRSLLKAGVVLGAAGIGGALGLKATDIEAAGKTGNLSAHVGPGDLDDYYGFWSGGHSGEIRIMGIPSGRELKRIPVFNYDAAYGWGTTNFSKSLLGDKRSGDTHHVHLSYNDGIYDGKYAFVNDKAQARLARIRLDTFVTDTITEIPNAQGTHGIFPSRNKLDAVYCNSEFRIPLPNDGKDMLDPKKYGALHTCIDAKSMKPRWQVLVDGNMDLCATDYHGKYSMAISYNSEGGVTLNEMIASDRDWLIVFNLAKIEADIKRGKGTTYGSSKVKVLDGRKGSPYTIYIPVPKSPHGVNVDPTGRYAVCAGKLSPTVSVVDLEKVDQAFAGKIKPRDCVVAEPEVGIGPLHTAFDNRGNAYTSIFIDSVITKWNIAKAIKGENPIVHKIDIHYQVGHINASMSETKEADGKWVISLNKFSKDRFLPVGPFRNENEQLIDISGEEMRVVHDVATHPEPHDAVIARRDLFRPEKVWNNNDSRFDLERNLAKKYGVKDLMTAAKVVRDGKHVYVFMTGIAPNFSLNEFTVKKGDTVTLVVTNGDKVEDLSHGICVSHHDVNFGVSPQETASATFKVPNKGVFWFYCPWFCHALHLEMRGRMIVT
ncbi:MAG: TAT-dependent nitrous-oxide reductase [Gammaproteobacteria bacterium]|nr:TAT-dependent nitrous-oxide reductase [Gammaproteobacteria bacterium]